jgi:hypothetical protein
MNLLYFRKVGLKIAKLNAPSMKAGLMCAQERRYVLLLSKTSDSIRLGSGMELFWLIFLLKWDHKVAQVATSMRRGVFKGQKIIGEEPFAPYER